VKPEDSKIFAELSPVVGRSGAFLLFKKFAGRRVYIPLNPNDRFIRLLGRDRAGELSRVFGGDRLTFPDCRRVRRKDTYKIAMKIVQLKRQGKCNREVANRFKISIRWVQKINRLFTLKGFKFTVARFEQLTLFDCDCFYTPD
jgi:hypothetical protein